MKKRSRNRCKPLISIQYHAASDTLGWWSHGWGMDSQLMSVAKACIVDAKDPEDAKKRLQKAGFTVEVL